MRTVPKLLLLATLPILVLPPASAAPITWADPAGLCAGNAPCFTTLADALANAGPAPAEVFVLPGTYAESLDLGTMGSAVPDGGPGELAIISVDATGQPASGAIIDPGAPGGPGTGDAISATAFPALLTLDGLVVRSPDLNGLFLTGGVADVRLLGLEATGSPMGNGAVVANASGNIEVTGSTARLNFNAGFNLATQAGQVSVTGTLAERNDGVGLAIVAPSVAVTDSQSGLNGDDGWLIVPPASGGTLNLTNVLAIGNDGQGVFSININPEDQFASVALTGLTVQDNANQGIALIGTNLTVTQLTSTDNGGDGLTLGAQTSIAVQQLTSARNGGSGALIFTSGQTTVQDVTIEDNLDGGLGVLASEGVAATASASGLLVTGNVGFGLAFNGLQDARFASVDLVDATVVDNTEGGIGVRADVVTAMQLTATNNVSMGVTIDAVDLADVSLVVSTGHTVGIVAGATHEARLTDADASNNTSGLLMGGQQVFVDRVTATLNGPGNGNVGSGAGLVFFDTENLDVTNSLTESNEVGWVFLELATNGPDRLAEALSALGVQAPEAWTAGTHSTAEPLGQGPLAPQRIAIETSRTLSNTQASMFALLREGSSFRVSCSDFVDNGPQGLELLTADTIDARANYWGATSGPTHPDNPAGTGDLVIDSVAGGLGVVLWDPFLGGPASPDDCPVATIEEIPTLPPFGLLLLVLALTGSALLVLRRRGG